MKVNDDDQFVTKGYLRSEFAAFRELIKKDTAEIVGEVVGDVLRLIEKRFEESDRRLDKKFEDMEKRFDKKFEAMDRKLDAMQQQLNDHIEQCEQRFDELLTILARVDRKQRVTDALVDRHESRLIQLERKTATQSVQRSGKTGTFPVK